MQPDQKCRIQIQGMVLMISGWTLNNGVTVQKECIVLSSRGLETEARWHEALSAPEKGEPVCQQKWD